MQNNSSLPQIARSFYLLMSLALIAAYLPLTLEHLAEIPEHLSHIILFTLPAVQLIAGAILLPKQPTAAQHLLGAAALTASITTSFFYDAPSFVTAFLLCLVILAWGYRRPSSATIVATIACDVILLVAGYFSPTISAQAMQMNPPHHASNSILYSCALLFCGAVLWLYKRHVEELSARLVSVESQLAHHANGPQHNEDVLGLYQFAELGRTASLVLHDLSNQMAVLYLDLEEDVSHTAIKIRRVLTQLRASLTEAQHGIRPMSATSRRLYPAIAHQVVHMRRIARQQGVTLRYTVRKSRHQKLVFGRHDIYDRIIHTLISNAIEACASAPAEKMVHIHVSSDDHFFFVAVQDTGIGISPERRKGLFRAPHTTKPHGNGVGLYASRTAMEHLGGSLELDPSLGRTRFILKIPMIDALAIRQTRAATEPDSTATDAVSDQYAPAQEGVA